MENFTHLQVHSHYTMLGGTASVEALAARAAAEGMARLALTDRDGLYGAVAFARACRAAGVEPIVGMTVRVAAPAEGLGGDGGRTGELVLLATGPEGYRSLCGLASLIQGAREREAVAARGLDWEGLKAHREGLICLSGGRRGWVERYVRAGDPAAALRYAGYLAGIYGEQAYLSLELHRAEDEAVARELIGLGERLGLAAVAVQPVYCLALEEAPRLRLLAAMDRNCRLEEVPASALPGGGDPAVALHWLSPEQVAARFSMFPRALAAVGEVAARCGPTLPQGRTIWPALDLPPGQTEDGALAALAQTGLSERYGPEPPKAAREQLEWELAAIARHGYAPLFLVVADIARFAREAEVPISTRGSVANSLVAYCAGITNVDPVAHELLFERFLNPARTDPPDIDLDLCSRRRDEVLEYVRRRYGEERMALVGTISTLRPRSAVRETAKAYGLEEEEIKRLVAALPHGWLSTRRRDERITLEGVLADLENEHLRRVVQEAAGAIGQPHHLSLHPGGVVITPGPLTEVLPVQWAPKGFLATQFGYQDLETLGLPKIDLLGVRALTVLADAAELVRRHYAPGFRLADLSLEDPSTGAMLARGETIGVFQCESAGARRTLRQLRARTVRDLAVANAFFKPGPAMGGMAETFVRRYRGEEEVSYLHPALEPILGATQGVLLFQEQILRIAREIAGLSWEEADRLRKGVKFAPEVMGEVRERFVEGCMRPSTRSGQVASTGPSAELRTGSPSTGSPSTGSGYSREGRLREGPGFTAGQAETLWEQVVAFAGYGFNQGHATAYADVSYRSAYLKAHWPAAFMCARLADRGGFHHPAIYIAEAVRLGIAARPPHVNHSRRQFTLEVAPRDPAPGDEEDAGAVLWMGLGQVRDLRRRSIRRIVTERRRRSFADLRDLLSRVSLQPKEVVHLIQCGGLDGLGESRAALLAEAEEIRRAGSAAQMALPFARPPAAEEETAQRVAWERHVLGQPVSVHPLELVAKRLEGHTPLRELGESPRRGIRVAGVRLPGWTGGQGFFLGDGETFVMVRGRDLRAPPVWEPVVVRGDWVVGIGDWVLDIGDWRLEIWD
jgi:DNA polymerase-3 subunit alpha